MSLLSFVGWMSPALLCVGLGTWQVQRYQWKMKLLQDVDNTQKSVVNLPSHVAKVARAGSDENRGDPTSIDEYTKVRVRGVYDYKEQVLVGPRILDRDNGFVVLTPMTLADGGKKIMVNRGWIPSSFRDNIPIANVNSNVNSNDNEIHEVVGHIRAGERPNAYTPSSSGLQWFIMDMKKIENEKNCLPIIVTKLAQNPKELIKTSTNYPIPDNGEISIHNNHLVYIFTWYPLAGFLFILGYSRWKVSRSKLESVATAVSSTKKSI